MTVVARYRRRSDVLSRVFGGEVLLANPDREGVDRLNLTAAAVWEVLETPATTGEVAAALSRAYDAPRAMLEHDVETLLGDLVARGWLVEDLVG
jgi:hypothetical protein